MHSSEKFMGRAGDYAQGRPGYASGLIDELYGHYGLSASSVVADVGAGTGKFSKYLLERGSEVYGVEPNADMRAMARKMLEAYEKFHAVSGDATHTTLESHSVDAVTAAQAFHWFDPAAFKRECRRIVKKDGPVFLIWNIRDETDAFNRAWHEVFEQFCPDFRGFSNGISQDDGRIQAFFEGSYQRQAFDYPLLCDRERFVQRSLSSSYSLKSGDENFDRYMQALNEVFDRYEKAGQICIANQSVIYEGTI